MDAFHSVTQLAPDIILRKAEVSDITKHDGLIDFYRKCADEDTGISAKNYDNILDTINYIKNKPNDRFLVVQYNKAIIGVILMFNIDNETDGKRLHIAELAILKDHRGKGLGYKLINIAKEYAHTLNQPAVSLYVMDQNKIARSLYEKTGFKYMKEYKTLYMEMPLKPNSIEQYSILRHTSILVKWK